MPSTAPSASACEGERGELIGAGVGSYLGLNAAALLAAIEFGIQPLLFTDASGAALYCPYPLSVAIPAMMLGHLTVAGLAEVGFTVGILAFVRSAAPSFGIEDRSASKASFAPVLGLVAALVAACPLGLLATGDAWGEWGTEDLAEMVGYTPAGLGNGWEWSSLMPDYTVGALPEWIGYILSAVIGVALLVIVFRLVAQATKRRGRLRRLALQMRSTATFPTGSRPPTVPAGSDRDSFLSRNLHALGHVGACPLPTR